MYIYRNTYILPSIYYSVLLYYGLTATRYHPNKNFSYIFSRHPPTPELLPPPHIMAPT